MDDNSPGCTGPPNPRKSVAFLDAAASVTTLGDEAECDVATKQEPNFPLGTPAHVPIFTSQTLELKLKKLPPKVRRAFRVKNAPHNLVSVAELVDADCGVYIYKTGFDIEYNGEIIYRGWRDADTN